MEHLWQISGSIALIIISVDCILLRWDVKVLRKDLRELAASVLILQDHNDTHQHKLLLRGGRIPYSGYEKKILEEARRS